MSTKGHTYVRLAVLVLLLHAAPAYAQFAAPMQVPPPGPAATERLPILKDVGITQKLNTTVPLDLVFSDETGREVRLGSFFGTRPVLLVLSYYECPMLCPEVLSAMVGSIVARSEAAISPRSASLIGVRGE